MTSLIAGIVCTLTGYLEKIAAEQRTILISIKQEREIEDLQIIGRAFCQKIPRNLRSSLIEVKAREKSLHDSFARIARRAAAPNRRGGGRSNVDVNHKHRKVLHSIFAHPVSANISSRAVESVFHELGAEIEQRHGGRIGVHLNGHFAEFSHDTHTLSPEHVHKVRKFLSEADIDPIRDYPI